MGRYLGILTSHCWKVEIYIMTNDNEETIDTKENWYVHGKTETCKLGVRIMFNFLTKSDAIEPKRRVRNLPK